MKPDIWTDFNSMDDDGYVISFPGEVVRPERIVPGARVVVADPEALRPLPATIVSVSPEGVIALDVEWTADHAAASSEARR